MPKTLWLFTLFIFYFILVCPQAFYQRGECVAAKGKVTFKRTLSQHRNMLFCQKHAEKPPHHPIPSSLSIRFEDDTKAY